MKFDEYRKVSWLWLTDLNSLLEDLCKENTILWGWLAEPHTGSGGAYWASCLLNANEALCQKSSKVMRLISWLLVSEARYVWTHDWLKAMLKNFTRTWPLGQKSIFQSYNQRITTPILLFLSTVCLQLLIPNGYKKWLHNQLSLTTLVLTTALKIPE